LKAFVVTAPLFEVVYEQFAVHTDPVLLESSSPAGSIQLNEHFSLSAL